MAAKAAFFRSLKNWPHNFQDRVMAELQKEEHQATPMVKDIYKAINGLQEEWTKLTNEQQITVGDLPKSPIDLITTTATQSSMSRVFGLAERKEMEDRLFMANDRIRFASQRCPMALLFMSAIPVTRLLQFTKLQWVSRMRLALGLELKFENHGKVCLCGRACTTKHLLTCNHKGGHIYAHEMNKHCLAGFANQGGLHTTISSGISFAAKNKRPDAVIVTKSGQTISLDVTGCHAEVAGQPLKGVEDASTAKHVMYDGLCQQEGSRLVAVSVDHL